MVTKIRVRCPCCGSLPDLDRVRGLERVDLQVIEQTFGGRISRSEAQAEGYTRKHGTAGIMNYEEVSDAALVEEVKALWRRRVEMAQESLKE